MQTVLEIIFENCTVTAADRTQWIDAKKLRPPTGCKVMIVTRDGYVSVTNYYDPKDTWELCNMPVLYWKPVYTEGLPGVKRDSFFEKAEGEPDEPV